MPIRGGGKGGKGWSFKRKSVRRPLGSRKRSGGYIGVRANKRRSYNQGTKKQRNVVGAGTNVDSQYVGSFGGNLVRRKGPNKYHKYGYVENVETHGLVSTPDAYEDGPVRFVVQAVNPPRIMRTVAIAYLRALMRKYYNREYVSTQDLFQVNAVAGFEKPYQIVFSATVRSNQTTDSNLQAIYTIPTTATLSDAADWLVFNVLTNDAFGYGCTRTTNNTLTGVDIYDRIDNIPIYVKNLSIDKNTKVHFWSSLKCRIQNVTRPVYAASDFSTDSIYATPLHGNVLFSKGHCPRVRVDNVPGRTLVPFTFEDVANGVIIPKTYNTESWYRTVQGIDILDRAEKGMNVNIGVGQIKDFTMYYRQSLSLPDYISRFFPGAADNSTGGTDSYGISGLNRNALIQLEKFVDSTSAKGPQVMYHCEWDMGANVTMRNVPYMPQGYHAFTEDGPPPA